MDAIIPVYFRKSFSFVLFIVSSTIFCRAQLAPDEASFALYNQVELQYSSEEFENIVSKKEDIDRLFGDRIDTVASNIYYYLGDAFYYTGDVASALLSFQKELSIIEKLEGDESARYAKSLTGVTIVSSLTPDINQTIAYYNELLPLDKKFYGSGSLEFQMTASELGNTYIAIKSYDEAETLYRSLLKETDKKNINYPVFLANLGQVYSKKGDFRMAKKLLGQSLDLIVINDGTENQYYAATLNALATLYYYKGQYAESELLNFESNKIIEKIGADYLIDIYSSNLNLLGVTYTKMGLYNEAEKSLLTLDNIDKQVLGTDHPNYAYTLNNLALLYMEKGDFEKAEPLYQQSMNIWETNFGKESINYAISLYNLGLLYRKSNQIDKSINFLEKSREIYLSKFGKQHPLYAESIHNLGSSQFALNNYPEALEYFLEAESIREKSIGKEHPRYGESQQSLALVNWAIKNNLKAEQHFNQLFKNYESQINNFFAGLSEQEKASFFNNKLKFSYEMFNNFGVSMVAENPDLLADIYDHQLSTKGLIMYSTNKIRNKILNSGDSLLIGRYFEWIDLKDKLSGYYSKTIEDIEKSQDEINNLTEESNRLEKELGLVVKEVGTPLFNNSINWKDVQKNLGKNEAAIEIIRVREFKPENGGKIGENINYLGLIVTRKTKNHPDWVLIKNGLQIEERYLKNYRNSIKFKIDDEYSYDLLWKSFESKLKGIKKIYISMDGVYNQVSLNTLYNTKTEKFLIDQYDIQLLTNTRDVIALKTSENKKKSGDAILFGFPDYNLGLDENEIKKEGSEEKIDRGVRGMDRSLRGGLRSYIRGNNLIVGLPGTKTEVENIASYYSGESNTAEIFTEGMALEGAMKKLSNPSVLHIATHGFFLEDQKLPGTYDESVYYQNPLIRSGLILAGVNHFLIRDDAVENLGGEDGVFTAYEALNLNLEETEIVVLSACETGLGEIINGEGVYGLQRAFQIAGADAVIMSLWNVDDDATQELMSSFYRYWLESDDKRTSFRKAQLDIREKYPEPFFWGAFVMVGE